VSELGFGARLSAAFEQFGHLCVGIDPHPFLLNEWQYDDTPRSLSEFSLRIVDACAGRVGIIKPQVAFYERHGAQGYLALENLMDRARQAGILVIADAKRGDIGSTMQAYAQSWLAAGVPLEADALTVSPYLGSGALAETVDIALANNKGVFVLAATSNPEAAELQSARVEIGINAGKTIAAAMLSDVARWSTEREPAMSVGAVLGATLDLPALGIHPDEFAPVPVLAPGFGFQGAMVEDARSKFGALAQNLIVSETRSVLSAGREGIVDAVARRADEVAHALN
jgi:orotidine-5'-phosphate decarboxylase